jgi:hypothetical protein
MKLWSCSLMLRKAAGVNANGPFPLTQAQGQMCIVRVKFISKRAWMEARLGHAAKEAK